VTEAGPLPTTYAVGSGPASVTTADVNHDGNADLIVANRTSDTVSVLLGTASGAFGAQTVYAVGSRPRSVTTADVNHDGNADLIVANETGNTVSVLLGAPAPATPVAPVLAHDSGTSSSDRITSDPTIRYPTPAAGDALLYSLDGSAYTTIAPPILKIDGTDDGAHTVSIEQRDIAGNISDASSLTFTLDTRAPATLAAPVLANDTGTAGDKITSDPTVTYPTPTAGDVLLYSTDGINFTTTAPTFATNGTADVSHTVSIEQRDIAGNVSGASSLTFTLDTRAPATPVAPVLANDTGTSSSDNITSNPVITYPTPAAGDVLLYSLDGSAYTTIAPPILKVDGTDDGAHTVSIEERDTAGNISGASSLTFTLDTQAPATPAAPVLVNDTATAGDKITSDPTVTYPTPTAGDVLLYSTDGINFTTTAPTFATNGTADVSHTVSIEEEDTAGNISGISSLSFTLDTRAPATPAAPVLANDTGTSSSDKITSNSVITYPTPAAGDVLLYSLDGSAYTTIAPPILKIDGTDDGAHTVSIEGARHRRQHQRCVEPDLHARYAGAGRAIDADADASVRLRQVADRRHHQFDDADLHGHR